VEKALAKVIVNPVAVVGERPPNPLAAQPKPKRQKKFKRLKSSTGLKRDVTAELTRICGVDLTRVIGLNVLGVLILISEIGVDMSRWRNAKAFCSWLGLCPGNKISGACRQSRFDLTSDGGSVGRQVRQLAGDFSPTDARSLGAGGS
jgi:hypothetical protein